MAYVGKLEERPLIDVLQIIAYSQQSGVLTVNGRQGSGLLVFERGNIICADSATSREMLEKAAEAPDAQSGLSLRRIHVLVAIRELFDIPEGSYRFTQYDDPIPELQGVSLVPFYQSGPLDTGDLLLVLEKAMDAMPDLQPVPKPSPEEANQIEQRRFPRLGPVVIRGVLVGASETVYEGYVTNVSLGGTFFHANDLPPLDFRGTLDFELPWGIGPCRAQVKVVWLRGDTSETKRGAGLLFESTGGGSRKRIETYIAQFEELAADVRTEGKAT